MSNLIRPIETNSTSSSSPSNTASFQQNIDLSSLAGQIVNVLNLGKLNITLSKLTNQIACLHRKVDVEFGEMEKPFSSPNDLKVIDNQDPSSISSSTSFSNRIKFPKLNSKDSKNFREKVKSEIQKDYKARSLSSDFTEYVDELSSSSSSGPSSSLYQKKVMNEIYDDLDKQVIKDLGMDNADLFYYKMDTDFKEDLDNMIKTHSSIFGEKKLVPPIHNSKRRYNWLYDAEKCAELCSIGRDILQICC
jgi:hypothetical protein